MNLNNNFIIIIIIKGSDPTKVARGGVCDRYGPVSVSDGDGDGDDDDDNRYNDVDFGLSLLLGGGGGGGFNASLNTAVVSASHVSGGFVGLSRLSHAFAHEVGHLFGARVSLGHTT